MKKFQESVSAIENRIKNIEVLIASGLLAAMVLLSITLMLLRNFASSAWALNFSETGSVLLPHFILLLGFVSGSIGISKREVIKMDVLNRLYSQKLQHLMTRVFYISVMLMMLFFIYLILEYDKINDVVSLKKFLYGGYIPVFALFALKAIFTIVNPQNTQQASSETNT